MAPITKCIAFLSLVLSATALTSPHISNNVFNHRRAVAHVDVQAVTDGEVHVPLAPKRKRSLSKRCVPKPSGNSTTVSSSSTSYSASASATSVPVNVAPSPVVSSSHSSSVSESTYKASTTPMPTPTPTPKASTTSTSQAAQTTSTSSSGSSSGFLSGINAGQGTYYETGLGACGITNTDSDYIAAVSYLLFDSYPDYDGVNPNTNPVCNKKVTATYQGKSVTVAITDRCTGCALKDLDFSPFAFSSLADESLGRIDIDWSWS